MAPMAQKKPRVKWIDPPQADGDTNQTATHFTATSEAANAVKLASAETSNAETNKTATGHSSSEEAEPAYIHAAATHKSDANSEPNEAVHSGPVFATSDVGEPIIVAASSSGTDNPSSTSSGSEGAIPQGGSFYKERPDNLPEYPTPTGMVRVTDEEGNQLYVNRGTGLKPAFIDKSEMRLFVPSDTDLQEHQRQSKQHRDEELYRERMLLLARLEPAEQREGEELLNTIFGCQQRLEYLLQAAVDHANMPAPLPDQDTSKSDEQESSAPDGVSNETVVATDGEVLGTQAASRGRSRTRYAATSGYENLKPSTASLYQDAILREMSTRAHAQPHRSTLGPLEQASRPDAHQIQVHEQTTGKISHVNQADFPRGYYCVTSDYRRECIEEQRFFPWRFDEQGERRPEYNNKAYEHRDSVTEQACRDGNNPTSRHDPFNDRDTPIDPDDITWGINPKPIQVKDYRTPAEFAAAEAQEKKNNAYRPPQLRTSGFRSYAAFEKYAEEPGRHKDSSWKPSHLREYHETVHGCLIPLEICVEENVQVGGYNLTQEREEGGRASDLRNVDRYADRKAQAIHDWWLQSQQREPSLMHDKGSRSNVTNGNDPSVVSASSWMVEKIKHAWAQARNASPPLPEDEVGDDSAAAPEFPPESAVQADGGWGAASGVANDPPTMPKADRMKGNWRQPVETANERADSGYGKANKQGKLPVREQGNDTQWVKSSYIKPIPRAPTINWEDESSVASSSTRGWGKRHKEHLQPWQTDEPLGDWNGNWNPPPLDWDMRPAFRNDQSKEGIDRWLEGMYSVRTFEALAQLDSDLKIEGFDKEVLRGEFAPLWWYPDTFGNLGYKDVWAELVGSQEPPPLEQSDLEDVWPWWERSFQTEEGANMHFLLPLDQPHTLGADPDNETAQQTQSRENDHGSLQHAENRKRQEQAKRVNLALRQTKAKEIAKTAAKLQRDSDSLHPVRTKPAINMYIRAAIKDDFLGVLKLYNAHILNSIAAPEAAEIDFYEMAMRFTSIRAAKLPFLVALERAVQPPKTVKGNPSRYADITITDKVIGFAFAAPYHGTSIDNTFSSAAKLEVWTDRAHFRKGIAKCLIDKLLSTLDSRYIEKCDVEFQGSMAVTTATRQRNVKNLFIECPFESGKEHRFWVAKWLEGTVLGPGFSRAGGYEGIGEKSGRKISLATFHKATAAAWKSGGEVEVGDEGDW